jgi:RND family efflux transporter MFP subunit
MKNKIKAMLVLLLFLTLGYVVYNNFFSQVNIKKTESAKVKRGDLKEETTISGEIAADEHITLRFQTSGRLTWVGVKEGDYIKKYQGIASLDQRQLKKTLEKYLNTYVNERYDFEQTHDDYWQEQYALSDGLKREAERIIKKSQNDLNSTVLDVELQNLSLEYANLWSPIEGLVVRVDTPFASVNITPAQAEFEIINPQSIYFSATVDQTEVIKLKEKMKGQLTLDSYPEKNLRGEIKNISFTPKTGETGTVYEIKFSINKANKDYQYRIGMTGDLTFTTKKIKNVLYLPIKFIKSANGKKYVDLVKNGSKVKTYITTGMETDNLIEITSGLSEGELVYD